MAHNIEELDRVGLALRPAWHGLGKVFENPLTATQVLEQTSVGAYGVVQAPGWLPFSADGKVWAPSEHDDGAMPPPGIQWIRTEAVFNLRDDIRLPDRRAILSPTGVGEGYEVVQNRDLVQVADAFIGESGAQFESAGTLKNGRIVWMLARMPGADTVGGQRLRKYVLIYSSHDGSKSIVVAATYIRVVCWNTLSAALNAEADNRFEFRHTVSVTERIAEAVKAVQATRETFERERGVFDQLAHTPVDDRFVAAYLAALYPNPTSADGSKRKTGWAEKKRDRIAHLLANQPDADGMDVDGERSAWGLYNAVTHYWQHDSILRSRKGKATDESEADVEHRKREDRFRSNMIGGTQERARGEALDLLLRKDDLMATVNATVDNN